MRKTVLALALGASLLLGGCFSLNKEYVAADREFFDAVAPAHLKYVDEDPNLTQEQKDRRHRLFEAKEEAIKAAEKKLEE